MTFRIVTIAALSILSVATGSGCKGSSTAPATPAAPTTPSAAPAATESAQGSCAAADGSCMEVQETYDLRSTCQMVQGTPQDGPCDAAKYARKCVQESTETRDGKEIKVHFVYFRADEDETQCLGTETKLQR